MSVTPQALLALIADDLMSRDVVQFPETMPLRDAAHLLMKNHIGGAPVVNAEGKCVGVLSAMDLLRRAGNPAEPAAVRRPLTCSFQVQTQRPDGTALTQCTLPPGVCPIQRFATGPRGEVVTECSQPHCVLLDWQVVELEKLPADQVRRFMTPDPVTVTPATSIRQIARMMIDAHIHRVIVVNEQQWPVGIVSSTDVLAALAYTDDD
jgi:CBS domain-containing protein